MVTREISVRNSVKRIPDESSESLHISFQCLLRFSSFSTVACEDNQMPWSLSATFGTDTISTWPHSFQMANGFLTDAANNELMAADNERTAVGVARLLIGSLLVAAGAGILSSAVWVNGSMLLIVFVGVFTIMIGIGIALGSAGKP
jgi:hypothetical protein